MLSDVLTIDIMRFFINDVLKQCMRIRNEKRPWQEEIELIQRVHILLRKLRTQVDHNMRLDQSILVLVKNRQAELRRTIASDRTQKELQIVLLIEAETKRWIPKYEEILDCIEGLWDWIEDVSDWILNNNNANYSRGADIVRSQLERAVFDGEALEASLKALNKVHAEFCQDLGASATSAFNRTEMRGQN